MPKSNVLKAFFIVAIIAVFATVHENNVHATGIDEPCTRDDVKIKVFHGKVTAELFESYKQSFPKLPPVGDSNFCLFPYEIPQLNISKSDYDSGLYDKKLPKECGLAVQENFGDGHICKPKLKMPDEIHSSDPTASPKYTPDIVNYILDIFTEHAYVLFLFIILPIIAYRILKRTNDQNKPYSVKSNDNGNDVHDGEFRDHSKQSENPRYPTYADLEDNFERYSWEDAEDLTALLFKAKGYSARVGVPTKDTWKRKRSSDHGIDVRAEIDNHTTGIQVKHWGTANVKEGDVIKTNGSSQIFGSLIIISTKKGFEKYAVDWANQSGNAERMDLWDSKKFKEEIRKHLLGEEDSQSEEPQQKSDFNYYEILGVSQDATQEEIKNNFRKISKSSHPDVNPSSQSDAFMKNVNIAYETLGDEDKRRQYDSELDES